ncbi:hypothetical protein ISN44_As04g007850 [Arabidopsis suecica]|uniref:Uncharacterized protein n=1 Tax=Arabidopsis suecica TaxID=45249 RepID=A0A8T2E6T3_ARASU|nr:hypothetical protein ISN44_As04g007850 [Arabidopsis suecica]
MKEAVSLSVYFYQSGHIPKIDLKAPKGSGYTIDRHNSQASHWRHLVPLSSRKVKKPFMGVF